MQRTRSTACSLVSLGIGCAGFFAPLSPSSAEPAFNPQEPAATTNAWPMFRGRASLLGVAPGALPDAPALLWSFKTAGPVKSSPAVVNGLVYFGSGDSNVFALNLKTGDKVWTFTTGGPI